MTGWVSSPGKNRDETFKAGVKKLPTIMKKWSFVFFKS
jgi:hypothetical protein